MSTIADKYTPKSADIFSDIGINFDIHPNNKQLMRLTNESAIKRSMKNLVMITPGEVPFRPNKGSRIRSLLFEQASSTTEDSIASEMKNALESEPRIKVLEILVNAYSNMQGYHVRIKYITINNPQPSEFTFNLQRVR